ncbi:uncharacterized protein LOC108110640 [Drosophila eugracilis]|uniref:uncharacterized protein LOC108110640 n=1 Tax=Drosophila eugracilis TaxID=29029 RepID=UPI0007E6EF5A|nr:uncharacterized protein LOC108110640 [Drosophila eugracilis]
MQLFSIVCLMFSLCGLVMALKDPSCGVKYRGVGLCKMWITKIVYTPSKNFCRTEGVAGCYAEGTFFDSIEACEAKCKE